MEKIKAMLYERIFKKRYLDRQKRICNENIRSWLQAMIDNNVGCIKHVDNKTKELMKEAIDYAEHLIALSKKNELRQIAELYGTSYQKLNYIYSEQASWSWESLMKELYIWYPQYCPKRMNNYLKDKIKGVIFGQAIGDALGLGTEFMSMEEVQKYYPHGLTDYEQIIQDAHRCRWKKGDWTDDTDMMLCIAHAIIGDKGKLNPLSVAREFKKWFKGYPLGIGNHTHSVLSCGDYELNPTEVAQLVWEMSGYKSAANGALMRTSIIGLLDDNIRLNAESICKLTHVDPRCVGSCVIVSDLIHNLVYRGILQPSSVIVALAKKYDERISEYIHKSIDEDLDDLLLDDNAMGYTLKTLSAALWVLYHCNSFEEGLLAVVNAGGDADTNAAVACSLLGARYGYSAIPQKYIDGLVRKEYLDDIVKQLQEVLT